MESEIRRTATKLKHLHGVSKIDLDELPSGVAYLTVWSGDRCFGLQYDPKQGSAVYDVEEQYFDCGPAEYFPCYDDAAARLIELVCQTSAVTPVAIG